MNDLPIKVKLFSMCCVRHFPMTSRILKSMVCSLLQYGTTPLIWASRKGHTEIVDMLLREGAMVDKAGMVTLTMCSLSASLIVSNLSLDYIVFFMKIFYIILCLLVACSLTLA